MEHAKRPHVRLTRRERQLVAEILTGHRNKAIAQKFGIKEQTVRNQLTVLFRKLGVSSRLELVLRFAPVVGDVNSKATGPISQ